MRECASGVKAIPAMKWSEAMYRSPFALLISTPVLSLYPIDV